MQNNNNNLKYKSKSYQLKLEFLKTQKFINLKRRCNKKIKIHQNIERQGEKENLFCERKLCKEWKKNDKFIVREKG